MPVKKYSSKEEAKKAHKEKIRLWRLKNKDRIKSKVKEYQQKNIEQVIKAKKDWASRNKDHINEKRKKFRKDNPEYFAKYNEKYKEKYKERYKEIYKERYKERYKDKYKYDLIEYKKKWRINNREKSKAYNLKYLKTEKGQITHLWDTLRLRIKIYTFSKRKSSRKDMDKLVGCSKFFLLKYLENKFYDHPVTNKKMTWSNTKEWHIDHITPLAVLDPKNEEHFKIANHFSNLQPMWAEENLKKSFKVTPGYGVAHLKRKYITLQSLGDLTNISTKSEADVVLKKISKLI